MLQRKSILKSKTTLKTSNKRIKIKSDKSFEKQKKYEEVRDLYLKNNPICEFEGCNSKEVECHHKQGRKGNNLFNHLMSVCREHHRWIHDNVKEALEKGYLKKKY